MTSDDVGIYCESLSELFLQPNKKLFDLQLSNKIKGFTNNSGNRVEASNEKDNCFQVKLLPKPGCNCVEKT
ncbi:unnamed protein product [Brachionus calyciflorus]|uniref:Uncharacterized protein n=1 Tax=Brachionus calyciflorus TaxID=104777 RepID=A0A813XUI3_9BILA|nr:unnamed protein product [Brachionus calyciflorus]